MRRSSLPMAWPPLSPACPLSLAPFWPPGHAPRSRAVASAHQPCSTRCACQRSRMEAAQRGPRNRRERYAMRIGFIGLGQMGSGMAANLLGAGNEVIVYNRTPAKAKHLVAQGAKAARSIAEACDADSVFTMLANDQAVEEVVFGDAGIIGALGTRAIHVSSSTISVALS